MASFNRVIISGYLTRDIELRHTGGGTAVCDVGVAINRKFKGSDGSKQEETTFVDCTLWGRTAEIASEYLGKGRAVLIEGRLQLDTWEDRNSGQKRSKLKVVGENLVMLGGGNSEKPQQRQQEPQEPAWQPPDAPPNDEVPF